MIKTGSIYKLDNVYMKCIRIRKSKINTFQICDKNGTVKDPVYSGGLIVDHGTRIVSKRIKELIEV